ncbi:MAG TPA: hypothetical protein EYP65_00615 [Armatimonadetes bacterium]|nr:hypothetical protein [Armatimonadota bacterium]
MRGEERMVGSTLLGWPLLWPSLSPLGRPWGMAGVPVRRVVSPRRPLFLFQEGRPEALERLPQCLRRYSALQLGAMHRRSRLPLLEEAIKRCERKGIPVALHIRTHWPVLPSGKGFDYEGKAMPPDVLDRLLAKYPNVIAVINAEQYAFREEQREYLLRTLEISARHGALYIFDAGWAGGTSWEDLAIESDLRRAILRHREVFLPMWEMNRVEGTFSQHAQILGLWLSGWSENWGANPQRWFWGEAGFGRLGERFGWRCVGKGGPKQAEKLLRHFPLYGQMVALTALTGATVFWIGGERPPTMFDAKGRPSRYCQETLSPLFERIVKWGLIPSRDEVRRACRVAIINPRGIPFRVDGSTFRTGKRSVRLDCGAGASVGLGWVVDRFIPVRPGAVYEAKAYVKAEGCDGKVAVVLSFYNGKDWREKRAEAKAVKARRWMPLKVRCRAPFSFPYAIVSLVAEGTCGTVWFDDASLKGPAGEELLTNGSFEGLRAPGRPKGWVPGSVWGPPRTHLCLRGVNAVWRATYGVRHEAELLPDRGDFFPIVWLPLGATTRGFERVVEVSLDLTAQRVRALLEGVKKPVLGPAFLLGDSLLLMNGHENEDITVKAVGRLGGLLVRGRLPVHSYAIVKREGRRLYILAEGRKDRRTDLSIEGARLRLLEGGGRVEFARTERGATLRFYHFGPKIGWAILAVE